MRRLLPSALSRGSFRSASALRSGICGTVTNVDAAPKITFDRMHHSFNGCSGSHGVVKVMKDVARPTQPMSWPLRRQEARPMARPMILPILPMNPLKLRSRA